MSGQPPPDQLLSVPAPGRSPHTACAERWNHSVTDAPHLQIGYPWVTLLLPGRADLQAVSSIVIRHLGCNRVAAGWLECCPERNLTLFQIAPQGDRQTARKRHYADASHALAASREALVEPLAQLAARLEAQPAPREFDHQPSDPFVAGLADTLLDLTGAARVRRRRQAQAAGDFTAVMKLSPAEQFLDQGPRTSGADTREP